MKNNSIKGIVIKVTKKYIVLMTDDGTFKNVPSSSSDQVPMLGQQFTYIESYQNKFKWQKYISIAAVFLLVFISATMLPFKQNDPAYIVAIDINPSIEIVADDNLQVIKAQGLNDDGKEIIGSLSEKNLLTFIEKIIDQAIEKGYLDTHDKSIITTVVPLKDNNEKILNDIENSINFSLEHKKVKADVLLTNESNKLYEEAKKENLSVNYYKLYKNLKRKGIVQDIDEIREKDIYDLTQMEREFKNEPVLPQTPSLNIEQPKQKDTKKVQGSSVPPVVPEDGEQREKILPSLEDELVRPKESESEKPELEESELEKPELEESEPEKPKLEESGAVKGIG